MRTNSFRAALREGRPTLGTRIHMAVPAVVELVGRCGVFDYVEFLAEPAPFDLFALENLCRAAELYHLSMIIKIEQAALPFHAQRAVGAGFEGVLFADLRDAEDVRRAIAAVRPDTPEAGGTYGATGRRMADPGGVGTLEYVNALNEIVVLLMVEKGSAVATLDDVLAVPGIDLVQFGPVDYAMSVGRAGEAASEDVRQVERSVIRSAIEVGIQPRAELASVDEAPNYLELGVRHFSIGTDVSILYRTWSEQGRELREVIASMR